MRMKMISITYNNEINRNRLWVPANRIMEQTVQTDRTVSNNTPDITIRDSGKATFMSIDVAISGYRNVIKREAEMILRFFFPPCRINPPPPPPIGPGSPIVETLPSYSDTPHSGGLLWTSDQPDSETSTWQHTTLRRKKISIPPGGIRTRNTTKRAVEDPRLRLRDHWVPALGS